MATLSDNEKTQLRLLERQLQLDDPKFVKTMRATRAPFWHRPNMQSIVLGGIGITLGMVVLIIALILPNVFVAVVGITLMLIGAFGFSDVLLDIRASQSRFKTKNAFMANLESKWDKRRKS